MAITDTGGGREPIVGEGVGRTLMTAFARQLHGEAAYQINQSGGVTATLVFPTPDADQLA